MFPSIHSSNPGRSKKQEKVQISLSLLLLSLSLSLFTCRVLNEFLKKLSFALKKHIKDKYAPLE